MYLNSVLSAPVIELETDPRARSDWFETFISSLSPVLNFWPSIEKQKDFIWISLTIASKVDSDPSF